MIELPPDYLRSMQSLLEDEYAAFMQVYTAPAVAGLRANTLKMSAQDLASYLPYELSPVPWCPAGFRLISEPGQAPPAPGRHPYHAAGLYYLQEPSAMAVAELLDPQPGESVLDLCAAPGGKSTHLSARMGDAGLLVANEIHVRRVWELAENLERWGARNVMILNESPSRLADRFPGFFDRVLVDAPCSGEGMFRKSEAALRDWSPELVSCCAVRQSAILEQAARLTRPGGLLGYSTCTFNPEENEQTLANFLTRHPYFELVETRHLSGLSPGCPQWVDGAHSLPLERSGRLWPHLVAGEGHFVALLRRAASDAVWTGAQTPQKSHRRTRAASQQLAERRKAFAAFCQAFLNPEVYSVFPDEQLALVGDNLYLAPPGTPDLEGLRAIRPGWWLGSIRPAQKGRGHRFEPSHALALGLQAGDARHELHLDTASAQVLAFLRGEVLDWTGADGWTLVCVDGHPLGWGRGVQGKLKNHYPRGLRWV